MRWNRIMMDIAVITLAFLLFIIWHRNSIENVVQTTIPNIEFYKVYLITTDKGYQYWEILNERAADMAAIEDAKARNVKIIYVDSPAYEEATTTLTTNNYEAGVLAGQTMISILDEMGIESGSIGIINLAAKENTRLREIGFRDTLAKDVRFKVLETIYTETDIPEDTQEAAERMINENEDLVALFGTSEGTSIGVGNAIKANENRYVGVGFDKTEVMTQLLNDGNLQAIIDQNPYTMGYLGMAQAVAAIFGKDTGPEYIDTGVTVVRRR